MLANQASAEVYTWVGSQGGSDWFSASNWDLRAVPGATDAVWLRNYRDTFLSADALINELRFSVGALYGPGALTVRGSTTFNGTSLYGEAPSILGALNVAGSATHRYGSFSIAPGGRLTVLAGATFTSNGLDDAGNNVGNVINGGYVSTFNNAGTYRQESGAARTYVGPAFNNTGSVLVNTGTLELGGGGVSTGSFSTLPGTTLALGGAHNLEGATIVNAGTLKISGGNTTLSNTAVSGTGAFVIDGGFLSVNAALTLPNLSFVDGRLSGTSALTVNGLVSFGKDGAPWWESRSQTINGTLNLAGGATLSSQLYLSYEHDGTLNNLAGSTFTSTGLSSGLHDNNITSGTFNNAGTFVQASGSTATNVTAVFNNIGSVQVQTGTLRLRGNVSGAGAFSTQPGATLELAGTNSLAGASIANEGTLRINDGTTTLGATGARYSGRGALQINSGTLNLNSGTVFAKETSIQLTGGMLNVDSPVTVAKFDFARGVLGGAGVLTVSGTTFFGDIDGWGAYPAIAGGTLNLAGGAINQSRITMNGGRLNNLAGSTFVSNGVPFVGQKNRFDSEIGGDSFFGAGVFSNAGVFVQDSGLAATNISAAFGNTGSVLVRTGTLQLNGDVNNTGSIDVDAGKLVLAGDVSSPGTLVASGSGVIQQVGGRVAATQIDVSSGGTFELQAGTLTVNQFKGDFVQRGGLLYVDGDRPNSKVAGNYALGPNGTLRLDVGGAGHDGVNSQLVVDHAVTVDGLVQVILRPESFAQMHYVPHINDKFDFVVGDAISLGSDLSYGVYVAKSEASFFGGLSYSIYSGGIAGDTSELYQINGDVFSFTLTNDGRTLQGTLIRDLHYRAAAPVPEPSAYATLLGGLGMFSLLHRRRRKALDSVKSGLGA
ncbi:hypothetical protein ASD35_24640 [Pelomonas sp. Root1444]|nr:hypothetical protein ASD35_24640 [Pelomonas sp. Root1444]